MRKILLGTALSAAVMAPVAAFAEESKWYLNPAVGYMFADDEFMVDDEYPVGIIGVENKLNSRWGVELWGSYGSPSDESFLGGDSDYYSITAGVLRYLNAGQSRWDPYLAAGIGAAGYDYDTRPGSDGDDYYTQLNFGVGSRYDLAKDVALKGDVKYLYGVDDSTGDVLVSLGLSFDLGYGEASNAEPAYYDTDGDGVEDSIDQCSGTPAGIAVDAKGCPLDNDRDGVPNYRDKCPKTAPGLQVDKFGCKFVLTVDESIKLEINFAVDSAAIPAAYRSELEKVAAFMKKYSGVSSVIEGHTDDTGEADYNKGLSQRRADAVRNALVNEYGIEGGRLTAVGYGEERPIASNETAEGRKSNRRVVAVMETEVAQ